MPPKTLTLGFDTSAAHVAAALLCDSEIIAVRGDMMSKGQAEHLLPMIEDMLSNVDKSWSDITRIGVGVGPGNFTGIRISVSAARGLALSLNIPAIGINGFEIASHGMDTPWRALVDAPRDQVYMLENDGDNPSLLPRIDLSDCDMACCEFSALSATEIAIRIAKIAQNAPDSARPAPLYIRAADAAPPKDPLPQIVE